MYAPMSRARTKTASRFTRITFERTSAIYLCGAKYD
jgi:hypothetical protein